MLECRGQEGTVELLIGWPGEWVPRILGLMPPWLGSKV